MLGYRTYYNGKEFVSDDFAREAGDYKEDSLVSYWDNIETAKFMVAKYNKHLQRNLSDCTCDEDFVIRTCKVCRVKYILPKQQADWFQDRGLSIPKRCILCRTLNRR